MGIVKESNVVGVFLGEGEFACWETCITKQEKVAVAEDCLVTQADIDRGEDLIFCDRCKKRIR